MSLYQIFYVCVNLQNPFRQTLTAKASPPPRPPKLRIGDGGGGRLGPGPVGGVQMDSSINFSNVLSEIQEHLLVSNNSPTI